MSPETAQTCDVAVVGGGPAGLSLAQQLREQGIERVTVLERDQAAGGVPRHCGHYPFGLGEFGWPMKGPQYAARKVDAARAAGVDLRTGVTVTDLGAGGALTLSSDAGLSLLRARRVALCTGARESSRAQRFITGSRPRGVITTGALQAFVYLEGLTPFKRPVILGTELVSFSALLTCRHLGIRPAAMVEENTRITARAFSRGLPALMSIPVHLGTKLARIIGDTCVEAVELESAGGQRRIVETDGVICSGQFRPEAALLRNGHLSVDPATGGPFVDQFARASDPAYLCSGNLLRPVETHSWCAKEGVEAAKAIVQELGRSASDNTASDNSASDYSDGDNSDRDNSDAGTSGDATPITAAHPAIKYVLPQKISADAGVPAFDHLQIRLTRPARGRLRIHAGDREIWSGRINALPERRILVPLAPLLAHRGADRFDIRLEETAT